MTMKAKKPDEAHKPRFVEKVIRPVEFVVRGGYLSLNHFALYLDLHSVTIYKWSVLRKSYPKGFPEAMRIGRDWRVSWDDVIAYTEGFLTYKDEKKLGLNNYDVEEATGKFVKSENIYETEED